METLQIPSGNIQTFFGADDILAALYASATAFICPSLYEGFGIPPLEAMSFGCPVACANSGSLPEVVGNAAEFFNPTDEGDMRTALERVVSSPERRQELVRAGSERIRQFSWEKCARETEQVYTRVLQG